MASATRSRIASAMSRARSIRSTPCRPAPAGAGAGLQGVERMLRALLMALAIRERVADAMGHAAQDLERRGRRLVVEKSARPGRKLAVGIAVLRRDEMLQIGEFVAVVKEGIEVSGIVRRQRELLRRIVLDRDGRGDAQRVRPLVEQGD